MSQWHRDNPELTGTWADPWMIHDSYRQASLQVDRECLGCGRFGKNVSPDGLCPRCDRRAE